MPNQKTRARRKLRKQRQQPLSGQQQPSWGQQHPFQGILRLPGELRNLVYRFALPKSRPILVSATLNNPEETRNSMWVIKPKPSFITRVSKAFRNEGLPIYYEANTFLLTDSMFRPGAIAAWIRIAGNPLQYVQSIKVNHQHPLPNSHHAPISPEYDSRSQRFQTKFSLTMQEDGTVDVSDAEITPKSNELSESLQEYGACQCVIAQLAAGHRKEEGKGALGNPLVAVLVEYAGLVEQYARAHWDDEKTCDKCGGVRSVGATED